MKRDPIGDKSTPLGVDGGRKESNNSKKAYVWEFYNLYKQPTKKFRANQTISFSDEDYIGIVTPHEDTLVITTSIAEYIVSKILVNNRSSVDIL